MFLAEYKFKDLVPMVHTPPTNTEIVSPVTNIHIQGARSAASPPGEIPSFASGNGRINILIVDDEPKNLMVLEAILDAPHYRLIRAESAEQALLALLKEEFAVIILDIRMPGATGFELAQMIKERKKTSQIPIIFLTAYYNEDQHVIEGYDSGAVDYLHKPINPAILRSKVAVLVELHLKQLQLENVNRALLAEIAERRDIQEQLSNLNDTLEQRVLERTEAYREAEQQIRMLMNEVNHRSKNILSVVMAIAQQTAAASRDEFVQRFSNRIHALAVNHDLLVKSQWKSIDISDLVRGQLAHFGDLVGRRISLDGQLLFLSATAAQCIGMVLHEAGEPCQPLSAPSRLNAFRDPSEQTSMGVADLALEPSSPDWAGGLRSSWRPGEAGAQAQLDFFLEKHLKRVCRSQGFS